MRYTRSNVINAKIKVIETVTKKILNLFLTSAFLSKNFEKKNAKD